MRTNVVKLLIGYCMLLVVAWPVVFGDEVSDFPDMQETLDIRLNTLASGTLCPAWKEVLSRKGSDGGQLTIELDMCQVFGYTIDSMAQNEEGEPANLLVNDLIVVWDEDAGHGEREVYKNFVFTGNCVADPNNSLIRLTTNDERTNWNIYRVIDEGVFTKSENYINEHEIIHFYDVTLNKVDDVNDIDCRSPGQEITYTIYYRNISDQVMENIVLIDWLPVGVTYPVEYTNVGTEQVSSDPNYNSEEHFYWWELGRVDPNEEQSVELTVVVNKQSTPTGILHNVVELWGEEFLFAESWNDTRVCCWDGEIIFVDKDAPGPHTGTSWAMACTSLPEALGFAANGCGREIHVAEGTYKPGLDTNSSFEIPDGILVYGGYAGYGADPNQRDWKKYPTILNGYIEQNDYGSDLYNNVVVTLADGSLLDGVTIEQGKRGIDASGATSQIQNCIIKNNIGRGIYVENGDLTVKCTEIFSNQLDGIHIDSSALAVINSVIYQNGADSGTSPYYGINLLNPSAPSFIRNNTIVQNLNAGLHFTGLYPPEILNTIVYYNGGSQLDGIDPDECAHYSCIADCNNINSNFNGPPGFAYMSGPNVPAAGNYHLAYDAPCVNAGDSDCYTSETDIDGEPRIYGTWVDVGADEAYAWDEDLSEDDIYHPMDWDADGVISYSEFAVFSAAWLSHDPNDPVCDPNHIEYISDPNDPGHISQTQQDHWNPTCNIVDDIPESTYAIDLNDFEMFCDNWLWQACWR